MFFGHRTRILMCVGLFCSISFLHTEESSAVPAARQLTIAELIDVALKNHPSTQKAWWHAQRAAAAVGVAKSGYYPHIDAKADVSHGRENEFINGPDRTFTEYSANLDLNMMLFDGGKTRTAVESTKQSLQAASWRSDWAIQTVMMGVFEAAYQWLYAQEVNESTLLSLQEAEKMFEAASQLNLAGLKPISDVYTSRARLSNMKMEMSSQKASFCTCGAMLARKVGLPPTTQLTVEPVSMPEETAPEALDQLLDRAKAHNADLQGKQSEYAAALLDVEKEEKSSWPLLSFTGQTGLRRYTSHAATRSSKERGGNPLQKSGTYSAGLSLEVPLFSGFEAMYKRQEALAAANVSQAELFELQLEVCSDIAAASFALESAREKLPEAKISLDESVKAYEAAFERYGAGKGEMVELYEAQQQVATAREQYCKVKMELLTQIVKLAYLSGGPLK